MTKFFVSEKAQFSETDATPIFRFLRYLVFLIMSDFVLKIPSESVGDLHDCVFDSANLIQKRQPAIRDNELARGIQSKSIRGLGGGAP